jgi:hypothetical protein
VGARGAGARGTEGVKGTGVGPQLGGSTGAGGAGTGASFEPVDKGSNNIGTSSSGEGEGPGKACMATNS